MKMNKGLAFEDLGKIAVLLVLIGVIFGMGVYVNSMVQTSMTTITITNESDTLTNLSIIIPTCGPFVSTSRIMNASHEIFSGNWTNLKSVGYNFTCLGCPNYTFSATWDVTYRCGNFTDYLAMENATAGVSRLASWLPIMAIIIAAAVIIGILMKAFVVRGGGV